MAGKINVFLTAEVPDRDVAKAAIEWIKVQLAARDDLTIESQYIEKDIDIT